MNAIRRFGKTLLFGSVSAALLVGSLSLTAPRVDAKPPIPGPLCGPTFQWSCTKIGGPSILFIGTICDKIRFERKTGTTCVPL